MTEKKPSTKKLINPANGGMPRLTKEEILKLLHRRDQKDLKLPKDFNSIDWEHIEFLAWKHPSGHKGYILENESGTPRMWVLECDTKASQNRKATMCSLCFSIKSGTGIKMFSYRPDNNRNRTIGYHLCSDLGCVQNVSTINPDSMRETITPERKRERMVENLHDIVLAWSNANIKED